MRRLHRAHRKAHKDNGARAIIVTRHALFSSFATKQTLLRTSSPAPSLACSRAYKWLCMSCCPGRAQQSFYGSIKARRPAMALYMMA
eukprot:scaffold1569_cov266-Pinguiococcus_pyrenoidosus.AAC.3